MNVFEIIKRFGNTITAEHIIFLAGIILFGAWLLKTSLGRKALADSVPRRNNMPPFLPFIPLFIWLGAISAAILITKKLLPDLPDWQNAFAENLILCIGAIAGVAVIMFLAKRSFARRLKGFGLAPKTIFKDFLSAVLNLLTVLPLLAATIIVTTYFGQFIIGPKFEFQQHQELELIAAHSQLPLRVSIIVAALVVVPVFEEMLFRGLFQTMLRSFLESQNSNFTARNGAWLSIAISSALFTIIHANIEHWPALFVLGLCMGYSYEKSGSLFRPIFIHTLFNATSIIAVLSQ